MKKDIEELFEEHYLETEESLQKSLSVMKQSGFTQADAIKVLINKLGLSLKEADDIVLNSEAWQNEKESTLKLRANFEEGLSE